MKAEELAKSELLETLKTWGCLNDLTDNQIANIETQINIIILQSRLTLHDETNTLLYKKKINVSFCN